MRARFAAARGGAGLRCQVIAGGIKSFPYGEGGAGLMTSSTWQAMNRQKRVGEMLSQLPNAAKRHSLPCSSSL